MHIESDEVIRKILETDKDLLETRFRLLVWLLTGELNSSMPIENINKQYFVISMTLYQLVKVREPN